jgi:hypothetical protein
LSAAFAFLDQRPREPLDPSEDLPKEAPRQVAFGQFLRRIDSSRHA